MHTIQICFIVVESQRITVISAANCERAALVDHKPGATEVIRSKMICPPHEQRLRLHIIHTYICAQLHRTNSRSHPVMLSHFALRGVRRRIIYLYRSADAMRKIMGNNVCAAHHEPRNTTGYMRARIHTFARAYTWTHRKG